MDFSNSIQLSIHSQDTEQFYHPKKCPHIPLNSFSFSSPGFKQLLKCPHTVGLPFVIFHINEIFFYLL